MAFRGTKQTSIINWTENLNYKGNKSFPFYPTANVWPRFLDVLMSHQGFLDPVSDLVQQYPNYQLVLTGHSLGATLYALQLYLQHQYTNIHLITFGSPRVGDISFRKKFLQSPIGHWRITHADDPVPFVPIQAMGFVHVAQEIYQHNTPTEYTLCSDTANNGGSIYSMEDSTCSNSNFVFVNVKDHSTYMDIFAGLCSSVQFQ